MPFLWPKRSISIDRFCGQFYDTHVFESASARSKDVALWWQDFRDSLAEADSWLKTSDLSPFQKEATALRLEVFAIAWLDEFERGRSVIPQSVFTKRYLEAGGLTSIWDAMGEYNDAVGSSGILSADGQTVDPARARKLQESKDELIALRVGENGFDAECVTRVANRLLARIQPGTPTAPVLAAIFIGRLGGDPNSKTATKDKVSTRIQQMYEQDREQLKHISLHESASFRWW